MRRMAVVAVLAIACVPQTSRMATGRAAAAPDALYGDLVIALSRAGVQVTSSDPVNRIATGTAQSTSLTTGDKPLLVVARVLTEEQANAKQSAKQIAWQSAKQSAEQVANPLLGQCFAVAEITATVQQAIDYGATARLLERVGEALKSHHPDLALDITVNK